MSRPHSEIVKVIDAFVRELDEAEALEAGEQSSPRATAGYSEILDVWERHMAAMDLLGQTLLAPLATGAAMTFAIAWDVMMGEDAVKLAGWLAHVGEAIMRIPK